MKADDIKTLAIDRRDRGCPVVPSLSRIPFSDMLIRGVVSRREVLFLFLLSTSMFCRV